MQRARNVADRIYAELCKHSEHLRTRKHLTGKILATRSGMPIGSELRLARARAGLSAEQIAERTKIQLPKIVALESDYFEALPDGIYLEGLVRAYAREVGIDPEPLIERVRHRQAPDTESLETLFISEAPERPLNSDGVGSQLLDLSTVPIPPEWRGVSASPPDDIGVLEAGQTSGPSDLPLISPVALAARHESERWVRRTHRRRRRRRLTVSLVSLFAAAAAAVWVAYLNDTPRLFDRIATSDSVASPQQPASADESAPVATPGTPSQNRPDDRIRASDGRTPSAGTDPGAPSDASAAAVPTSTTGISRTPSPEKRPLRNAAPGSTSRERPPTAAEPVAPPAPVVPPAPAGPLTAAAPEAMESPDDTAAAARDVSGSWALATHVESSSYGPFQGLDLGYEIQLKQAGGRVTGAGRKVTERGSGIASRAQTRVQLAGSIDGDRLTLTFTERGARRPTQGKFVLLLDEDGMLRGRFSSTAARSSGTVEAHRVPR